jgi:hypothetical protein
MTTEKKLLLEKVYAHYVNVDINSVKEAGEEVFGLDQWCKFRLYVSGGAKTSMGSIGMETIKGFLYELKLYDDIMCDWAGQYRGDFEYENREGVFGLLDEYIEDIEFKNEIKEAYNIYFEFED